MTKRIHYECGGELTEVVDFKLHKIFFQCEKCKKTDSNDDHKYIKYNESSKN